MRPYSTDLRERVAAAVDDGEGSQREIATLFRVSLSFIVRLLQRRRDAGTLEPKPHGGGPPPVLGPDDQQRLAELIHTDPDATLKQLKQRGGFTCSLKTLWCALRRQGLTFKKKSLHVISDNYTSRRRQLHFPPEEIRFDSGFSRARRFSHRRSHGAPLLVDDNYNSRPE
jgi:transposase